MPSSLVGQTIQNTYKQLTHVDGGLSGSES